MDRGRCLRLVGAPVPPPTRADAGPASLPAAPGPTAGPPARCRPLALWALERWAWVDAKGGPCGLVVRAGATHPSRAHIPPAWQPRGPRLLPCPGAARASRAAGASLPSPCGRCVLGSRPLPYLHLLVPLLGLPERSWLCLHRGKHPLEPLAVFLPPGQA